jgi:type IV secretion system protein VirB10
MSPPADTPPTGAPPTPAAGATAVADRGISPIAGRAGFGRAGQAAGVAALAAGCGLFLLATARHPPAPKSGPPLAPAKQVVAFEPAAAPTLDHPGPDAPSLGSDASPGAPPVPAIDTTRSGRPAADLPARPDAAPASPILAYSRGRAPVEAAAAGLAVPAIALPGGLSAPSTGVPAPTSAGSELDQLRRAQPISRAHATRLPNRSFLILAGTSIPCVLQTAMDTSTPGYVSCVLPTDVWSDNGAVVLLEKGTRVLGEYRGGLKQGQARIFVAWTRAVTPGGVAVSLASPASDALGRAGFDGELDNHFWQRFGGAVLLSVIDDGFAAAARTGDGVNLQAPSQAADTALKSSIDIPPTLRRAPGAEVAIFAAEDFDFSAVYGLAGR